ELPIQAPVKFELVNNMKSAQATRPRGAARPARHHRRGDRVMGWMAPFRHRRAKLVFCRITRNREPSMSEVTTIGLDLAKHVFQVHGIDAQGATGLRKRLRRGQVLAFFSRIPRCLVGLEACTPLNAIIALTDMLVTNAARKRTSAPVDYLAVDSRRCHSRCGVPSSVVAIRGPPSISKPCSTRSPHARNAATALLSNRRPRPGLSGRTNAPFSSRGVSSNKRSIRGMYSPVSPTGQAAPQCAWISGI